MFRAARNVPRVATLALVSLALVAVVGLLLHVAAAVTAERARSHALVSAQRATDTALEPLLTGSLRGRGLQARARQELERGTPEALRGELLLGITVYDSTGAVVQDDERTAAGAPDASRAVRAALAGRPSSQVAGSRNGHHQVLEVYVPLQEALEADPAGVVRYALAYDAAAGLSWRMLGGLGLLWVLLFAALGTGSARLRRALARNEHQARHDALTGLPNRTVLFDRVQQGLLDGRRTQEQTAVLLLDLDRFKEVNDTVGHHIGDLLLLEVATRLTGALRESDTLARLGGDEFAVLLGGMDPSGPDDALAVAHRLIDALEQAFDLDGMSVVIGASVGVAYGPEHGETPERLLQCADVGMYAAKRAQTGAEVYSAERDTHSRDRLVLRGELRAALADRELVLHYQPKSDVGSRRVVGFEALVRWQHPTRGMVPPDVFVPLAEQTGLMDLLTPYVLERALRAAATWPGELAVSVNVSVRNLVDHRFPLTVSDLLRSTGFPASRLVLEITESSLMADPETALSVLRRLKRLGVGLSVDDYGSGYSSLAYLRQLPVDELKIDRSFVGEITDHPRSLAIVRSTVELGKNLGLVVVAEGVEDEAAWQALDGIGCDLLQGYHLSRPLPEAAVVPWLEAYAGVPVLA